MCNAFDLSLVVVGGAVALGFGSTFFHAAQTALDEQARLPYSRGARITPSRLGDEGPLVGAGAVGWRGVRRSSRKRRASGPAVDPSADPTTTDPSTADPATPSGPAAGAASQVRPAGGPASDPS
jgi:glucokinase